MLLPVACYFQFTDKRGDILVDNAVFALFRHNYLFLGEELFYLLDCIGRYAAVIDKGQLRCHQLQLLKLSAAFVGFQHTNAGYKLFVEHIRQLCNFYINGIQCEIQQLTAALYAYRHRQSDGYGRSGIEAFGMGQGQTCPLKGSLEQTH